MNADISVYNKVKEMAAADQSNLTATVFIADMTGKSVRKLAQAHNVSAKMVHAALMRICSSQRSRPGG